jgi:transcriptional regulator GlxA family with amidase domain
MAGAGRPTTRRIVMLAYPDAQMVDVMGPLEVFAAASKQLAGRPGAAKEPPAYQVEVVASQAGPVRMSSGIELVASRSLRGVRGEIDTLMIAGGEGSRKVVRDAGLIRWLQRTAPRARRVASVCTGALLLAEAGLLEGRRATTHWAYCEALANRYPRIRVEADPIFVRDGHVYTSAGVTAGMDLALALVEDDFGRETALDVARWMVIFMKRPGGQSQFSAQLESQLPERDRLRVVQSFIVENPAADLAVESLAQRAAMSPRNFARVFAAEVGTTPARFVERVRVEAARRALEESDAGVDGVASVCGFGSSETMRRAFVRNLRVSPAEYRNRFRSTGS